VTVAEAVAASCEDDTREGQLECATASISSIAESVGVLAEAMNRAGLLRPEDFEKLLSYRYSVGD
jgi:hypothetical protein